MALTPKAIKQFSKFLSYALGRKPDEFGLIPDNDGYFKIKTVLQALHEDPQWRHVRQADFNTLAITERPAPIEIENDLVRATDRDQLPGITMPDQLPKLVYSAIRRRAYPRVHANGIRPTPPLRVIMSDNLEMARRLGSRMDNSPIILTINTDQAVAAGSTFHRYGDHLYSTDFISVGSFSGPPLPKEKPVTQTTGKEQPPVRPKTPGSYFPDLGGSMASDAAEESRQRRDEKKWKKDRRRARREKTRYQNS